MRLLGKTITLFLLAISSSACGLSIGDTHLGSSGYIQQAMKGRNTAKALEKFGLKAKDKLEELEEK